MKAMLEFDAPESCRACLEIFDGQHICKIDFTETDCVTSRHPDCPLKIQPITESDNAISRCLENSELLQAMADDGRKWAEAFLLHHKEHNIGFDIETLHAWFASAIEYTWEYRKQNEPLNIQPEGLRYEKV